MKNKKYILVAGLGKSGVSIAKFLKGKGENIIATDIDSSRAVIAAELENQGIKTEIGFHKEKTFLSAEKIIVSPGIPLNNKYLAMAAQKGIPVTGEFDIAAEFIDIPVIAVTGTNGKTTVTTLISEMLTTSGLKVFTCGNIGTPLVEYFMVDEKADIIVAEVSSFQLDTAGKFSPDVAVLLNITEDHINRYKDFSAYSDSKWSIFKNQSQNDIAIINYSIKEAEKHLKGLKSIPVFFGRENIVYEMERKPLRPMDLLKNGCAKPDPLHGGNPERKIAVIKPDKIIIDNLPVDNMSVNKISVIDISGAGLKGEHNRENMAAASLACLAVGGTIRGIEKTIKSFKGLAHRIQYAGTINQVDYIDDSKATNPDAVVKALECFKNNIILILGGRSKNTDFSYMGQAVKKRVKKIISMGESKTQIRNALADICEIVNADTMKQAVDTAYTAAQPGDTVLLSPACASFDMYESYAARGDDFILNVKLKKQKIMFKKVQL